MRTLSILLALGLATAALGGCGTTQLRDTRSMSIERVEERAISPLRNIRVSGAIKVRVYYAPSSRIVIRSNSEERMRNLRATSKGKTLLLSEQSKFRNTGRSYLVVEVYTSELEELRAEEASSIELLDRFDARSLSVLGIDGSQIAIDQLSDLTQLKLRLDGGCVLEAKAPLRAKRLDIRAEGSAIIRLGGEVERLNLGLSGASTLEGRGLLADKADIELEGSGLAKLEVGSSVSYSLSGASRLHLYGSPRSVKGKASGAARILQQH